MDVQNNTSAAKQKDQPFVCYVLTLFPAFFDTVVDISILGRARERDLVRVVPHDIREHTTDRHRTADDTPYGGGAGMVMKAGPIVEALDAVTKDCLQQHGSRPWRIAMAPTGTPFTQDVAQRLARKPSLAFLCGRYEGMDERAMSRIDETVSLGDFVLTGGEPAALAMIDAIIRFRSGVLGNAHSAEDESFGAGLLEYPQYTRPASFEGHSIPDVLRSGHHGRIEQWRRGQALLRTARRRPALFAALPICETDRKLLQRALDEERASAPAQVHTGATPTHNAKVAGRSRTAPNLFSK